MMASFGNNNNKNRSSISKSKLSIAQSRLMNKQASSAFKFVNEYGHNSINKLNKSNVESSKSRISVLLTTLSAQLSLIKANFGKQQQLKLLSNRTSAYISSSTSSSTTLIDSLLRSNSNTTSKRSPLGGLEYDEERRIKIVKFFTNTLPNQATVRLIESSTASTIHERLCTCNNSNAIQQEKFFNVNNEINNIWKLAFFILAFFIGFVSLLLILVFSVKIFVAKLNKRKVLKYDLANYYLPTSSAHHSNLKSQMQPSHQHPSPKIASISMLDFDQELLSSSPPKNGLDLLNKNTHAIINLNPNKKRTLSSSSSSPKYKPTSKMRSSMPGGGGGKHHKTSINSQSTTITTSGSSPAHLIGSNILNKASNYITEEELLRNNNNYISSPKKSIPPSTQSQQCYIYGITNRGFLDDSQISFYNSNSNNNTSSIDRHTAIKNLSLFETNENSNNNNNNNNNNIVATPVFPVVPSSFRPLSKAKLNENGQTKMMTDKVKSVSNKMLNELDDIDEMNMKKLMTSENTYQVPWKPPNDYEALETNTVTGSLANLSSVTTFSEIYSEAKAVGGNDATTTTTAMTTTTTDNKSSSSSSYSCSSSSHKTSCSKATSTSLNKDFSLICSNTNEHISRSSKITQELEARLKERRQLMESKSDKFQPKLLHENEFTSISQAISLSHLEQKLQNWSSSSTSSSSSNSCANAEKKTTTTIPTSNNVQSSGIKASVSSCICPCHLHKDEKCIHKHHHHENNSSMLVAATKRVGEKKSGAVSSTMANHKSSRKPKIIIDGSSTLPTKRESIRMLIENKAVSENKQKNALEMHLNTLICSRKSNTCKINT